MKLKINKEALKNRPERKKKPKGKKEAQPKEKPIEKIVSERAAAQIIARAEAKANSILEQDKNRIMDAVARQAKWRLEGNYKEVWTGTNFLKIYPDGSKELEVPMGMRGKAITEVWDTLFMNDKIIEEDTQHDTRQDS